MARMTKNVSDAALDDVSAFDPALAAHVAVVVDENPRGAPITLPAPQEPPPNGPSERKAPASIPFCVLDDAPINSVLAILQWPGEKAAPHLQTPDGVGDVPPDDQSWKLPLLAEIKRTGPHVFVAIQRDDMSRPRLVCSTAVEACRTFKKHFHDERE